MPIDMRQHVEFRMNVWLQFMSKLHDLESVVDAQHALIRTLPKKHAISWLGGRITNLDERMHSLAGTFTDHEELTQVRQLGERRYWLKYGPSSRHRLNKAVGI